MSTSTGSKDKAVRSLAKAVSWRLCGSLGTFLIARGVTGRSDLAFIVCSVELAVKIGVYYAHERIWDRVSYGQVRRSVAPCPNGGERKPCVIWFTGLPGAGKTTLAEQLAIRLRNRGAAVAILDGDATRKRLPFVGYSAEERNAHVQYMGFTAARLEQHGITVLCAFVSPYSTARDFVRRQCAEFVEVYVSTPLGECESRDPKGLYSQSRSGKLQGLTGIDAPYQAPTSAEIEIDTTHRTVCDCVDELVEFLDARYEQTDEIAAPKAASETSDGWTVPVGEHEHPHSA